MSDTPNHSPATTGLKSSSVVILKIATTGGAITANVSYGSASQVMQVFAENQNLPQPPGLQHLTEPVLDEMTGETVAGPVAIWDWSEVTAVWIEPFPPDDGRLATAAEFKRSNDLRERELALRERESIKPREPWEGDE
jgi:hypothetical protein